MMMMLMMHTHTASQPPCGPAARCPLFGTAPSHIGAGQRNAGSLQRALGVFFATRRPSPLLHETPQFFLCSLSADTIAHTIYTQSHTQHTQPHTEQNTKRSTKRQQTFNKPGVPLKEPVAGIAMGLVLEPGGAFVVLSDILGSEDALGDMDFKVAGGRGGVTAFQMDIKVEGITLDILAAALAQAGEGRARILEEMERCAPPPRRALSPHAPVIAFVRVDRDKIGAVIGPVRALFGCFGGAGALFVACVCICVCVFLRSTRPCVRAVCVCRRLLLQLRAQQTQPPPRPRSKHHSAAVEPKPTTTTGRQDRQGHRRGDRRRRRDRRERRGLRVGAERGGGAGGGRHDRRDRDAGRAGRGLPVRVWGAAGVCGRAGGRAKGRERRFQSLSWEARAAPSRHTYPKHAADSKNHHHSTPPLPPRPSLPTTTTTTAPPPPHPPPPQQAPRRVGRAVRRVRRDRARQAGPRAR